MEIRVHLLSGSAVPAELDDAQTVGDVRHRVAEALGVLPSRVELHTADGLLQLESGQMLVDLELGDLMAVVLPPHALDLPEGKLMEICKRVQQELIAQQDATAILDLGMIGPAPHTPFRIAPLTPVLHAPGRGYIGHLSTTLCAGEIRRRLCKHLGISSQHLSICYQGRDLIDDCTFRNNGVHDLGPAARRSGRRIELYFSVSAEKHLDKSIVELVLRIGEDEWQRLLRSYLEPTARSSGERLQSGMEVDAGDQQVLEKPTWWDTWPEHDQCHCFVSSWGVQAAVQELVNLTWGGGPPPDLQDRGGGQVCGMQVQAVIRNESRTLWETYCRTKALMATREINACTAGTSLMAGDFISTNFGDLDVSVNEFLLFRGIEPLETNCLCHDIEIPSDGLHFAGTAELADVRANGIYIGDVHGTIQTMLLCRVVCGNPLLASHQEMRDSRESLQQRCKQEGYHSLVGPSLRSQTEADFVLFKLEQVYPEFLIIYRRIYA